MSDNWGLAFGQGFESGFKITRSIQAVRQQMQDRENLRVATQLLADDAKAEETSELRLQSVAAHKTWMDLLDQQTAKPESVDARSVAAAQVRATALATRVQHERYRRHSAIIDQHRHNPLAVEAFSGKLDEAAKMSAQMARASEAGLLQLGQTVERDAIGDQAQDERDFRREENRKTRESSERVAMIGAAGRHKPPDPGQAHADALTMLDSLYDDDDWNELGEPMGMKGTRLKRRAADYVAKRFLQGMDAGMDEFLAMELETAKKSQPETPEPAPKKGGSVARRAGRALRRVGPEQIKEVAKEGAIRGVEAAAPPVKIGRAAWEFYRGWKEEEPLETATESVGGRPLTPGQ